MKNKPDLEGDITYIKTPKAAPSAFEAVDCGVPITHVNFPPDSLPPCPRNHLNGPVLTAIQVSVHPQCPSAG